MLNQNEDYSYQSISASTLIKTGSGQFGGIFCSSVTGGTVTVYDNTTASNPTIVASFTPAASTPYPFPCRFSTGLYIAITGTVSLTVFFN